LTLAHQCVDPLAREETIEVARISKEFQRDQAPLVMEAMILDSSGVIQGSGDPEQILEPFRPRQGMVRIADGIFRGRNEKGLEIYDVVESVVSPSPNPDRPPSSSTDKR
jgi:hypothetical protein